MRTAIHRCKGHALSLTLLSSLLQTRNVSLAMLLKDPQYTQLWTGDIAHALLDTIYKALDSLERGLLGGFSAYREPVPLDAANAMMEKDVRVSTTQIQGAMSALLMQHLLEAKGEGRYHPHAIVVDYVRAHLVEGNELTNRRALLDAQSKAAHFYLVRAKTSCPLRDKRRNVGDVHDLIEAVWLYAQAEQWLVAYELMREESLFDDIKRWGGNAVLLELYQLLLPLDRWNSDLSQTAHIYNDLGWVYSDLGQKKLAQEYYEQALSSYRTIGDRWGEGHALFNLGLIDNTLGKKDTALQYFEQALSAHREVDNRRGEGRTLTMIGRIYGDSGQLALALDHYEQALAILRQLGDEDWEARALHNLGMAYYALGQKDSALDYYEQALTIDRKLGDRGEEGKLLNSIGLFYNGLGQPEKALGYLEQALSLHREIGNKQWESVILNNVGTIYLYLLQDENALRSFGQAWRIEQEVGNRVDEGVTLGNIGTLFFKKNQYRAALACFLFAQSIFQEVKMAHRSITSWIAAMSERLGDEQFAKLKAQVEPMAQQIVDQALREEN
jgi:tetratricopeptide (TPR) repeat protein